MGLPGWTGTLALGILAGLWMIPPYAVIDDASGGVRHAAVGHHPAWSPPTEAEANALLDRAVGPVEGEASTRPRVIRNDVHLAFETLLALLAVGGVRALARRRTRG
jgi:hypothetical protein